MREATTIHITDYPQLRRPEPGAGPGAAKGPPDPWAVRVALIANLLDSDPVPVTLDLGPPGAVDAPWLEQAFGHLLGWPISWARFRVRVTIQPPGALHDLAWRLVEAEHRRRLDDAAPGFLNQAPAGTRFDNPVHLQGEPLVAWLAHQGLQAGGACWLLRGDTGVIEARVYKIARLDARGACLVPLRWQDGTWYLDRDTPLEVTAEDAFPGAVVRRVEAADAW